MLSAIATSQGLSNRLPMLEPTSVITPGDRLDWPGLSKAALIFIAAFVLYFLSRSPGLDEYDSVQFAMGVRDFNIWAHQPHPPGYPLFIFFGWIGYTFFRLSPEVSLYLVSSLGGALFVASWFLLIRLQFNERVAWWITACLAITPAVWMTATKVLTDPLAAGFLSAEILAALCFLRSGRLLPLVSASLFGAAAAGARPQLILVIMVILATALAQRRSAWPKWMLAFGTLVSACLLWLLPMWYLQARLRPDIPPWLVYPKLLYDQWRWRLDKPHVYLGAGDWSPRYLGLRLGEHIFGWFGLGFGLLQSKLVLGIGAIILVAGFAAYFLAARDAQDRGFWKLHAPWSLVHFTTIFISLDGAQRYYLIIFPLLLVALMQGFLRLPAPWHRSAFALPALLLFIGIPLAMTNHSEEAPPIRLVHYLQKLYPSAQRSQVILLLHSTKRHADWYAPEFTVIDPIPSPEKMKELTKDATAVYTDDDTAPLPPGWRRISLIEFRRSLVIYIKHHLIRLYLIDRGSNR